MPLETGTLAPDFLLMDQSGAPHRKSDYAGRWLLIYFYPKDDTPGCTKEACGLRDRWSELQNLGCAVLGVSADSSESHAKFLTKHSLPFTLLSDPKHEMLQAYGAWQQKSMYGKFFMGIARISFLVDPDGRIAKAYPKVNAAAHADEVIRDLSALRS